MDEKTFKEMLVNITPEALKEAHQVVSFLDDHLRRAPNVRQCQGHNDSITADRIRKTERKGNTWKN